MFTRILICGSRDFDDRERFNFAMEKWVAKHGIPEVVIEGCARGADSLAGHWWPQYLRDAAPYGDAAIPEILHFPADWDHFGLAAGPIRNQQMLDEGKPQAVIAFTYDLTHSRGTADMVRRTRAAGLPLWIPLPQTRSR